MGAGPPAYVKSMKGFVYKKLYLEIKYVFVPNMKGVQMPMYAFVIIIIF